MITLADELRAKGWRVSSHNDYILGGEFFTYWLFTKGHICAKGEGRTDEEAIQEVMKHIERLEKYPITVEPLLRKPCVYCKGTGVLRDDLSGGKAYCGCTSGRAAEQADNS
jgi:hypothetical protein